MPSRSCRFHAETVVLIAVAEEEAGCANAYPLVGLGIVAAAYIAWQVTNLWRLYSWVRNPVADIPQSYGLWADIYDGISVMETRDRRQKEKYRAMIG